LPKTPIVSSPTGTTRWTQQLVDANPLADRKELDVAKVVGKKEGDNEHLLVQPHLRLARG
jgi:zinc/manganese transport system substrate-binding protein